MDAVRWLTCETCDQISGENFWLVPTLSASSAGYFFRKDPLLGMSSRDQYGSSPGTSVVSDRRGRYLFRVKIFLRWPGLGSGQSAGSLVLSGLWAFYGSIKRRAILIASVSSSLIFSSFYGVRKLVQPLAEPCHKHAGGRGKQFSETLEGRRGNPRMLLTHFPSRARWLR